jgi:hypothetical protein
VPLDQVVERPEQQDDIERVVWLVELAGVSALRVESTCRAFLRVRDVEVDRVDEHHLVPDVGQPLGVQARAATDVEHPRRWRWEVSLE